MRGRAPLYDIGVPLLPHDLVCVSGVYPMAVYVRALVPWLAEQLPAPARS